MADLANSSASNWSMKKTCEKCATVAIVGRNDLHYDEKPVAHEGYTRRESFLYVFCKKCGALVRIETHEAPPGIRRQAIERARQIPREPKSRKTIDFQD